MSWWGKVIGGTVGFVLGGPLGALLGTALGHQLDKQSRAEGGYGTQERVQTAFFTASFSVLGHLAKADGRVSRDEIEFAEAVMAHMALQPEQRRLAIELFREGKAPGFDLGEVLAQFRRECHRRSSLMRIFLEIQLQAAYADGVMDAKERAVLLNSFDKLGFSRADFEQLDMLVRAAKHFTGRPGKEEAVASPEQLMTEAHGILGISQEVSDAEVKQAYRRLMSQHHPDKLVAKGLPEEMVKLANEKTAEIKSAYEQIKKFRGMK